MRVIAFWSGGEIVSRPLSPPSSKTNIKHFDEGTFWLSSLSLFQDIPLSFGILNWHLSSPWYLSLCYWLLNRMETPPLSLTEVRMPYIDNQNKTHFRPIVPDFMLKTIIKYENFALMPRPGLLSHPDKRCRWHFEPQMGTYATISWTTVWPNMRSRMHYAEFNLATSAKSRSRKWLHDVTREWSLLAVFDNFLSCIKFLINLLCKMHIIISLDNLHIFFLL